MLPQRPVLSEEESAPVQSMLAQHATLFPYAFIINYIQKPSNKIAAILFIPLILFSFHFQHFELDAHVAPTSIISSCMEHHQEPWEQVCALLTGGKVSPAEVFMLGMQALETAGSLRGGRGTLKRARRIILLGAKNLEEMEQSVSVA